MLFFMSVNLFGMQDNQDNKEQPSDSTSVAIPVTAPSQDESRRKSSLGLHDGCCAICFEPVDVSIVKQVFAYCGDCDRKISCSRCTAIYHKKCLEQFFSISTCAEAHEHKCPSRCGTVLSTLSCSQRLTTWCRKNMRVLGVLLSSSVVVFEFLTKYSPPSAYVCAGLAAMLLLAVLRGGFAFANEARATPAFEERRLNELNMEFKKMMGLQIVGVMAIVGAVLLRFLVLE
jgi:hypothetical protein